MAHGMSCPKMPLLVHAAPSPIEAAMQIIAAHRLSRCSSGYDISVALDAHIGQGPTRGQITEALYGLMYA